MQILFRPAWLLVFSSLVACTGSFGSPDAPRFAQKASDAHQSVEVTEEQEEPDEVALCQQQQLPAIAPSPIRRLNNAEYIATLNDLFPMATGISVRLPSQGNIGADFENIADTLGADDAMVQAWETTANKYSVALTKGATFTQFLPCSATATSDVAKKACGEQFIREVGRKTLRRPLSSEELARYLAFFEEQRATIDFAGAVQLTLNALLQAPDFLYRIEVPDPAPSPTLQPVDGYAMASRISYFVTGSMPDANLLDAAGRDQLRTPEQLEAQVRRLLETPKARAAVVDFHRQWLDFNRLLDPEHLVRAPEFEAVWSEATRDGVYEEQKRFVEHTLFDGDGSLKSLLLSRAAFVNASTARLYGVPGPADDATWMQVELPAAERAGYLTRAGFLASRAHVSQGSPPLRGLFVMRRLLCAPAIAPPANANTSTPENDPNAGPRTNRQLFEERTSPASCQGCHLRMNGLGFGFESYDAVGAYRTSDNGMPVDASGVIVATDVDRSFTGALELSQALAESKVAQACATQQWVRYALGRQPSLEEKCMTTKLSAQFSEDGANVRELIVAIVKSEEFRSRATIASVQE